MSMPLEEHDYIGAMPISSGLNLKATELRLGLPGSESPERESDVGYPLKGLVSGAKRGFSHTINASSGNWVLSAGSGSDTTNTTQSGLLKEAVPPSPKAPVPEKKQPQVSVAPAAKAQVVGWPPIRSFRKNSMAVIPPKNDDGADTKLGSGCLYVKVSMDGAPYLRKVDLKTYSSYMELSSALEKMFSCFTIGQYGSHAVPTRDGLSESRLKDILHGSEYVLTYEDKDGDWMLVGDVPWEMFTETCKRLRIMKSSDAIGLAPRAMEKCRNRN